MAVADRRPLDGPALRAPIFVVGCWRSGTTYLAQALGRHPAIAHFPRESAVLRGFFRWLEDGVEASPEEKVALGRRFVSGWLDAYRRTTGKPRVLEKTPPNVVYFHGPPRYWSAKWFDLGSWICGGLSPVYLVVALFHLGWFKWRRHDCNKDAA